MTIDGQPPRLTETLTAVLEGALTGSGDRFIRAPLPSDWPVGQAADALRTVYPSLRLGVLRPFSTSSLPATGCAVSDDPHELTTWRGEDSSVRRANPTIIFGEARGPDEAGLISLPTIVRDGEVLAEWRKRLLEWVPQNVAAKSAGVLFETLLDMAGEENIDPLALDRYVIDALSASNRVEALKAQLWRLNLFPDSKVLDTGVARSRLDLNRETRQLLLAAADTPADVNRLSRLKAAADGGSLEATRALQYRDGPDPALLEAVDLESIRSILHPSAKPTSNPVSAMSLFDLLDEAATVGVAEVKKALTDLRDVWSLDAQDRVELEATVSTAGGSSFRVQVPVRAVKNAIWTMDPSDDRELPSGDTDHEGESDASTSNAAGTRQPLAFLAATTARRDWQPNVEGRAITAGDVLERAVSQDEVLGSSLFAGLVGEYLDTRTRLAPYERWLRHSAFELLILDTTAREAVRDFVHAWQGLTDAARQQATSDSDIIRAHLVLLEALWGMTEDESVEWCVLGPFHPYTIMPLLRIVDYALDSLGVAQLGEKVRWAVDHAIPAYHAMWAPGEVLLLTRQDEVLEFQRKPTGHHPPSATRGGLRDIVRSFLGYHPFAREGLVITLIDPPRGGAVSADLREVLREVKQLRVYLVSAAGDTSQLEELGDIVRYLGRFTSLGDWRKRAPKRSHLLFWFRERPAASATAATAGSGPTSGAHVALEIKARPAGLLGSGRTLVPYVTFSPRDNDGPVIAIQQLAEATRGAPRLFEVQPMLPESEWLMLTEARELADWVVIGAPGPLGLIPPRSEGKLTFLGRESLGLYALFVYATSLFSIRKLVSEKLRNTPTQTKADQIEEELTKLAVESKDAVLRIGAAQRDGGAKDTVMWEHMAALVASRVARGIGS